MANTELDSITDKLSELTETALKTVIMLASRELVERDLRDLNK